MDIQIPEQGDYREDIMTLEGELEVIKKKLQVLKDMQKFEELLFCSVLDAVKEKKQVVEIILKGAQSTEIQEKISEILTKKGYRDIVLNSQEGEKIGLLSRYLLIVRFSIENLLNN